MLNNGAMFKQHANSTSKVNAAEENICVVCFKNVDIYSIGECDHPVCYECSTRMRVLCQQNECPICRQILSKVIFTHQKLPYRELEGKNRSEYYSKKYKIGFHTWEIQQNFFELLEHPCPKCNHPPFRTFQGLRIHVRKEHGLHYCDLCVEHLKIFTFERCCYTESALNRHCSKGDVDNTSHRGHPLCKYCNKRFLDRDELFRHLRREHYFCHFCDADGCNEFYRDYAALAEHFRQDHYLCEEGKCATEEFTGAFRSEIDYKAHVANVHGKSMNKQQAKQTRTLQLEITLGPRGRAGQMDQNVASMRSRGSNDAEATSLEELGLLHPPQNAQIDPHSEQEFPALSGTSCTPSVSLVRPPPPSMFVRSRVSDLARTKENFPALCTTSTTSGNSRIQLHSQCPSISSIIKKPLNVTNTGAIPRTVLPITTVNAPTPSAQTPTTTVGNSANSGSNGMVIHVSNRPNDNNNLNQESTIGKKPFSMDFPALSTGKVKKQINKISCNEKSASLVTPPIASSQVVSSKHRPLVDDYVSMANSSTLQKIQIVKKEELEARNRKESEMKNTPKFTSQDFPLLGGGSPKTHTPQAATTWIKYPNVNEKRQKEMDNRKNKVAPTPILTKVTSATTISLATNSTITTPNNSKKENNRHNNINNKTSNKIKEKKTKERSNHSGNNNISSNISENRSIDRDDQLNELNVNSNHLKPPPGFALRRDNYKPAGSESTTQSSMVTLNSIAKSPNNLTFTSSMGESFTIIPAHSYTPPIDALKRNQKLVSYFKESLKIPEALTEFRDISQQFREGNYKTQAYYEHCQAALKDKFNKVFPELVFLLPDISKQQALYLVHQQYLNTLSPDQRSILPKLQVCSICKQVLSQHDLDNHQKMHELKENFPQLNGSHFHVQNSKTSTKDTAESTTSSSI